MSRDRIRDTSIRFQAHSRAEADDLLDRTGNSGTLWIEIAQALTRGTNALELGDLLLSEVERIAEADAEERLSARPTRDEDTYEQE